MSDSKKTSSFVDPSFKYNHQLHEAVNFLDPSYKANIASTSMPDHFPIQGLGETATLNLLAPFVLHQAADLGNAKALAHMDPPTPWITWATSMWNASLNQNLLHPATSPFALQAETKVMEWLAPYFGMQGGHMCAGATLANLTALWAARDSVGINQIVASSEAHISIAKSARILGIPFRAIDTNSVGEIDESKLPDLSNSCLVLSAGTTGRGAVDNLQLIQNTNAKWHHVDAAWAGPLVLSAKYKDILAGIEHADSTAVSAHKWLYQPKDSAIIMFKDLQKANAAIAVGSDYLIAPNIGVQGSRSANAVSLLATMLAWGEKGFSRRIETNMQMAQELAHFINAHPNYQLLQQPVTGINLFRCIDTPTEQLLSYLPKGLFSTCKVNQQTCLRSVAANPNANISEITKSLEQALKK